MPSDSFSVAIASSFIAQRNSLSVKRSPGVFVAPLSLSLTSRSPGSFASSSSSAGLMVRRSQPANA